MTATSEKQELRFCPSGSGLIMILSDRTIKEELKKGKLVIEPLAQQAIQPSSVDLRLGWEFRLFTPSMRPYIDPRSHIEDYSEFYKVKDDGFLTIHPRQFILGTTLEKIEIPNYLVARLDGRSSLGRLGVMIHATAGFVPPGWKGHLVLEISNVGTLPIALYPEMKICQISFARLTEPAQYPYGSRGLGSKYQGQKGVAASRLSQEFKK